MGLCVFELAIAPWRAGHSGRFSRPLSAVGAEPQPHIQPVPASSIPTEGVWHTRSTQCGRLPEHARPYQLCGRFTMAAGGRNRPVAAPDLRAASPTDRHEPRVRKRRPKNYPLMTKPRAELMQALSAQRPKPYLHPFRGWHLFTPSALFSRERRRVLPAVSIRIVGLNTGG